MGRVEIERKFDEIVAFAEIEKFLDTPVKHYSSGMYMRLAFSVAAHLESEILVVDEVLAVGDSQFQKRCLGRMEEMRALGRTVLFVSHNMPAVLRLCNRVVLLDKGSIAADGEPNEVARYYLHSESFSHAERIWSDQISAPGDSVARLRTIRVRNHKGEVSDSLDIRKPVCLELEYWNLQSQLRITAILHFINEDGVCLFASNDFNNQEWFNSPRTPGIVRAVCKIPGNFFAEGRIFVLVALGTYNPNVVHAVVPDAVSFQIIDRTAGDGVRGEHVGSWPGVMRPLLDWEISTN
jgi:lipopolysaccharide transport system ATP-binding protein